VACVWAQGSALERKKNTKTGSPAVAVIADRTGELYIKPVSVSGGSRKKKYLGGLAPRHLEGNNG